MKIYDKNEIPEGYHQKSRTVYILLAIFFYGLGIHEFYRGNKRSGFGLLGAGVISQIMFWGGLQDGVIYFFPLVMFISLFIVMIISVVKINRDANGVLMK